MRRMPPPLDTHTHLAADIEPAAVRGLGAFVFAMTRSTSEFADVEQRRDIRTIWAVGTHPGLARVNRTFDLQQFSQAMATTPVVGEVGLDGASRVPMAAQVRVFREILQELQASPRVVSVHSSGAHFQLIRELHRTPVEGVILHWWTGTSELTEEALRLGCYFSLPPATMSNEALKIIPLDRVLPETDHPYGDRHTPGTKRPGGVDEVEGRLGARYGLEGHEMRVQFWKNLRTLVDHVGVRDLFGAEWKSTFASLD